MKIVVLDGYGLNPGDLSWEEMQALGELTVYDRTAPAELLERSAGAEVLITNKTVITAEDMAALPALKYIGVLATGYNIVDIQAAKARGTVSYTHLDVYKRQPQGGAGEDGQWFELPYLYAGSGTADCGMSLLHIWCAYSCRCTTAPQRTCHLG